MQMIERFLLIHPTPNMHNLNRPIIGISLAAVILLALSGCTTNKTTTTARSATEQLLLSTSSDHALRQAGLDGLAGQKVYLDATYFDSYDSKYVLGSIRDAVSRAGGVLVNAEKDSDVVIEARSGALAIDESQTMFGIPSLTLPMPLSGPVQTPEIAFYKSDRQRAYAKFALLATTTSSGTHVFSSGPLDGQSYTKSSRLLFVSWKRTDMPEKHTDTNTAAKYQTWQPQYDLQNLSKTNNSGK